MVFKVNDDVMAKWPGSTLWFTGTIVDLNDREYQVRFHDEAKSEYVVRYKDVKTLTAFSKRSRSRSRGRSKSRSRRANPAQPVEVEKKVTPEKKATPPPKEEIKTFVNAKLFETKLESKAKEESPKPVARLPTIDNLGPRTSTPTRQSLRIAALSEKNAVDGQANNVNATSKTTSIEEEEEQQLPRASIISRLCSGVSCAGSYAKSGLLMLVPSLGTVITVPLILVMLALPLLLNRMCTKNVCTVMAVPDIPLKLEYYYDLKAVGITVGILLLQLILGLIPVGRKVDLPNGVTLRCNGYLSLLLSLAVIPVVISLNYKVTVVYRLYQHFLATMTALALIVSLLLYVKARNIPDDAKNPKGNTGCFLPDFFVGRESLPTVLGVDLKFLLFRTMATTTLLLNSVVLLKDLEGNQTQYSPTLIMACALQTFAAADLIWFEESLSTTFEYTRMGCGLMFVHSFMLLPFISAVFPRIVLNHRTEWEWYFLFLFAAVNFFGYTLYRGSYSQIHAFKKNPSDPALAHLESVPTSAGTRLLVSGWWGVVRHPNYLGNIIIILSLALVCGFDYGLPWVLFALFVLALVQRIYTVEKDSRMRFGTAWDSYTERVKYRLIPKVF